MGQLFEVLGLNGEEFFKFGRNHALKYKKSYRFYYFGILHLSVIRAKEVEVTLFYHIHCSLNLIYDFNQKIIAGSKNIEKSKNYTFLHPFLGRGLLISGGKKSCM